MSEAAVSTKSSFDGRLAMRQLLGTMRLDLRRSLLSPRSLAVYFLAFAPLVLVGVWALTPFPTDEFDGPQDGSVVFTVLFQLYIRVSVFFSGLFLFVSLYRSEILERSLHYYLLTPIRRDLLALGKYAAALIAAAGIFLVGTTTIYLVVLSPWGTAALTNYLFSGPGLGNLIQYLITVVLACAGYGALFLLIGVVFRNPVLPAAALWVWEAANPLLPSFLKHVSVIYYLQSLYPVPLARGLFEVVGEPAPMWAAIVGAIVFIVVVLGVTSWRVRRMDLAYGGE
jgi:ABC-type transport system involved in multi-copper enzyme maturation permease subunit